MAQIYVASISESVLYFREYNSTRLQIYEKYEYHFSDGSIEKIEKLVGEIILTKSKVLFDGVLNSLLTISNMEIIINKMKELSSK